MVIVGDQAINSVTNIVVVVLVAHGSALRQFGIFATVQLAVGLGQTVFLAAIGDRWLQDEPSTRPRRFAAVVTVYWRAIGALLIVSIVLVPAVGLSAFAVGLAAAPAIAGLDFLRVVAFSTGQVWKALRMDVAYGGLQLGGVAVWLTFHSWRGAAGAWLAWAFAAYLVFALTAGTLYRTTTERRERPPLRSVVGVRYGGEMLAVSGGGQVSQLITSAQLGVAFNGVFRATQIPFGPLVILLQASRALLIPAFRPAAGGRPRRLLGWSCACYAACCVGCGLLALAVTSVAALRPLIGGVHPSESFVLLTGLVFLTLGPYTLVYYFFRAHRADRRVGWSRAVVVVGFSVTAATSLIVGSASTFLVLTSITWVAGTLTMLAYRPQRVPHRKPLGAHSRRQLAS